MEKTLRGKVQRQTFPPSLEVPQKERNSHFPTAFLSGQYSGLGLPLRQPCEDDCRRTMIPQTYKPKKKFMQLAIVEVKRAGDRGDYAIGAVITQLIGKREVVIASAGNRVKTSGFIHQARGA